MFDRILIATDGEPLSRKAVTSGVLLARKTGAEVVIVTVIPRYHQVSYFEGAMLLSPQEVASIEKQWEAAGRKVVEAAQDTATAAGIKVQTAVCHHDSVAECLLHCAESHKCDLLVMASHGRGGLSRVLLGSATLDVLTHSTLPVLVLR